MFLEETTHGKGGETMGEKKSYAGKIKNSGSQAVEAVNKQGGTYKPTIHRGNDLRATAGGKKKE